MSTNSVWMKHRKWWTWLDSDQAELSPKAASGDLSPELDRVMPFIVMHAGCLAVFLTGWSPFAVAMAVALYFVRMFAVTGFYHRYFSHKTFRTSRFMQAVFAVWGATCVQKGALWWASNHRHHHQASDTPADLHSPVQGGFFWSHMGWLLTSAHMVTDYSRIKELAQYPELVWLNRFDWVVPLLYATGLTVLGSVLHHFAPALGTTGPQMLVWGFFISTVVLYHGTWTINSLSHVFGTRRYKTIDDSRNNFWLALLTMGEGWHNNHHRYPGTTRQGFYWWEVDVTYYGLKLLSWVGLIHDLKEVPNQAYTVTMRANADQAETRKAEALSA